MRKEIGLLLCLSCFFAGAGCSALSTTGRVTKNVAKATWGTAKVTGKVLKTTGEVVYKTGQVTSKGVRTIVYMARGKQIIRLERKGNSLYTNVRLNRKRYASFLVDTGASSMQISRRMARSLKIDLSKADQIPVSIAGGHMVSAREVTLKEVSVGGVRVKNVKAIVMDQDNLGMFDGLLGMSFLNHFVFQIDVQRQELILQQRAI